MTRQPKDNLRTPAPSNVKGDGGVEHTPTPEDFREPIAKAIAWCTSPSWIKDERWKRCLGEADRVLDVIKDHFDPETAAERDRLIEDKMSFQVLIDTLDKEVTRLKASNKALVEALEWYEIEGRAAEKHMADKNVNPDALLALLTVLANDGGGRARAALKAIEEG